MSLDYFHLYLRVITGSNKCSVVCRVLREVFGFSFSPSSCVQCIFSIMMHIVSQKLISVYVERNFVIPEFLSRDCFLYDVLLIIWLVTSEPLLGQINVRWFIEC